MVIRRRAGSSHELPDALSRLLRPGSVPDPVDNYFTDDATSGERDDNVGPQGPILNATEEGP